ncbi:MAG: bifunctional proline dehydrogenase/L-glutamate gamma-semialdehyde dehydrogenase PutA [Alphaproteobacteria bacterium]|nr:bifunctional proline dehydrogenase/L-glutamate gamma-semialdehyde dehydrogenase PutA [Alphaproteobacteria bacterium]
MPDSDRRSLIPLGLGKMRPLKLRDEDATIRDLLAARALTGDQVARVDEIAKSLAESIRAQGAKQLGVEHFLAAFGLSTAEGVALMCLAEALLRIPDAATVDRLIAEKLGSADWLAHLGDAEGFTLNASAWALALTGRLATWAESDANSVVQQLRRAVGRVGEPVIRVALRQAMGLMADQFVMGETIERALARAAKAGPGVRHSFDMLGEAARTATDAARYHDSYAAAIRAIGARAGQADPIARPGISIKLSALHPRYEPAKIARVRRELLPRLAELCRMAKSAGIPLTIDAEEADRLALSLDLLAALGADPSLMEWDGLGLAVQAYGKRAVAVIDWCAELAAANRRRLMVRLVKGAYWDSEVKWAQERGLPDYPVFTRKAATDLSYTVCAQRILAAGPRLYGCFATHNPRTLAEVLELAGGRGDFEFQKLHGMGDGLYAALRLRDTAAPPVRVYAPVGDHRDLLPYLVRRLLENGANTSFIHQIADRAQPLERILADPVGELSDRVRDPTPPLPRPPGLYPDRRNSAGLDLADDAVLARLQDRIATDRASASGVSGHGALIHEPADRRRMVGHAADTEPARLEAMLASAVRAAPVWSHMPAEMRAATLERAGDLIEQRAEAFISLLVREAGKTLPDAHSELRETVDYARYYAARARAEFGRPRLLPGPTGERNTLALGGRGVFACISPWNFPLAIFAGQVLAALAAGNAVIAKPAEQTPLVAALAVSALHEAGVPRDVLHCAIGPGETTGAALTCDPRIAGVAFTGSTAVAQAINRALAARNGPIAPLIAETGGVNAMLVDSSALPEQVVADVITSAFQSAGQRCSALRALFIQDEAAPRIIDMLAGAVAELAVGDPADPETDVGPVIDAAAARALAQGAAALRAKGRVIAEAALPAACQFGNFVAPLAVEVPLADAPRSELFGPVLPVIRFAAARLDSVLAGIASTGYGLTLGIHSRLDIFVRRVAEGVPAGNTYVNRSMIGAVVGVQPFGGHGLSGTGPKAGGPHYLPRFARETSLTVNTAAIGGDVALMAGTRG